MRTRFPRWPGSHDRLVFAALLVLLLAVPIPLGSNRPLAWFAWESAVYGLLAFWAVGLMLTSAGPRISAAPARILIVLSLWLILILLQSLPLPGGVVAAMNPFAYAMQQNLGLISVSAPGTLSMDPGNSYNEFLKYGSYVAMFGLTLAVVTTKQRLLVLAGTIILAGVLESLFGIYAYATGYVVFPETGAANELRAGTFVNRNHFANLLTMSLGLVLGLITGIVNRQREGHRLRFSHYGDTDLALFLLMVGTALLIVAGIFVSGSRAPVVFFSVAFGLMLAAARSVPRPSTGEFVLGPVMLLGVAGAIVAMGFDESIVRLLDRDLLGGERMLQNAWGLKLLFVVWMAGVGAGNYQWAFPMFRGDDLRFATYDHAHNDYLQSAVEQGIPVAAILALGVILMIKELYCGYRDRRNPVIRGVIFGCLTSMGFMLLHALVEFNFRIPANAVYFFVIAGLGIAACRIERGKWRSRRTRAESGATNER